MSEKIHYYKLRASQIVDKMIECKYMKDLDDKSHTELVEYIARILIEECQAHHRGQELLRTH